MIEELYYGAVALISADNPASSALGGFKEGSYISTMLSLFCVEVKQRNGNPYTPKSILQVVTNLQHSQVG